MRARCRRASINDGISKIRASARTCAASPAKRRSRIFPGSRAAASAEDAKKFPGK